MTCLEEAPDASSAAASFFDEDGWENCGSCGAYADGGDDGANSTDTESDFEFLSHTEEEWESYLGSFEGTSLAQLREEYFLAKARFRHAVGKRSRSTRFPRRAPWARKGKGKRTFRKGAGKAFRRG